MQGLRNRGQPPPPPHPQPRFQLHSAYNVLLQITAINKILGKEEGVLFVSDLQLHNNKVKIKLYESLINQSNNSLIYEEILIFNAHLVAYDII